MTPGCTLQYRSSTLTSSISAILVRSITIPPLSGTVWPHIAVPAPRGTIGIFLSFARSTIFWTSFTLLGLTMMSGLQPCIDESNE